MTAQHTYPFQDPNLPVEERVKDLVSRLTLEEKISQIPTRQAAIERFGIGPYSVGGEAAHGVAWRGEATVFPQPIGLACTWNPELMKEIGSVVGDEARVFYNQQPDKYGLTLWAPTVDMERDPRWGRTEEAYGEDPHLTGTMTVQLAKGMHGEHPKYLKMVPTLKHFYANNNEKDRLTYSASIDPRNKHEYYLKPFEAAIVDGQVQSIMTAYNSINGTPAIESPDVNKYVKGEWGLGGFIVCDGGDLSQTVDYHHYHETHAESAAGALKRGVDCLTDDKDLVIQAVTEAIERGMLSEADLDRAITNIFRIRMRLGLFDPPEINPYSKIPDSKLMHPDHAALSLKAAKESVVLLKNDQQTLPLKREKTKKLAVIGPLGDVIYRDWYSGSLPYQVTPLQGLRKKLGQENVSFASSLDRIRLKSAKTGQYVSADPANGEALSARAIDASSADTFELTDWGWGNHTLKSLRSGKFVTTGDDFISASAEEVFGWFVKEQYNFTQQPDGTCTMQTWNGKAVISEPDDSGVLKAGESEKPEDGIRFMKETVVDGLEEAITAAKSSDAAVVFVGNNPVINGKEEIDREDIVLPPAQEKLIQEVYKVNPNTIVVIVGSYPFAVNWAQEHIPAILYTSHSGQEIGHAIADVLYGDYAPAGRLNMTWYRSVDQLPDIMDYDIIKGKRTYMYFDGEPLYPFGHGLTYASFDYSDLQLSSSRIGADGSLQVSFNVTNNGEYASDEVVQLYARSIQSRVVRPLKELKAFRRIHLLPGQSHTVTFTLRAEDLAIWDVTRDKYCVEAGDYEIMVGKSSADIQLHANVAIDGEQIPPRTLSEPVRAENYDDYAHVRIDECLEGGTSVRHEGEEPGWTLYKDAQFTSKVRRFEVRASNGSALSATIEIRLGSTEGQVIGTCQVSPSGDWQAWTTESCEIKGLEEGLHDICLVFHGDVQISWFCIKA
ncbi:glycoside hydrolase family 3 C-terminal domain-containing protein [Marinicrinis lubricantis]|uniref:Glycoside hydrolase family 3 C-terminal domain-containing protein n=1 Tax=Marinicrinis lubricantis TaxID=2086470 RepID=A0ABW1IKH4_9BACL